MGRGEAVVVEARAGRTPLAGLRAAVLGLGALAALVGLGCLFTYLRAARQAAVAPDYRLRIPVTEEERLAGPARALPPLRFAEVARQSGVDFVHTSGTTEAKHFPTANGSGVAVFDADGDGRMDLYFATATYLPVGSRTTGPNRFYRNLGEGRFADETDRSGLGFRGFTHGIVVGDVDGDGDQDVVLCNYGPNAFYRNRGDGTFADETEAAGLGAPGWSSGGAFLDYDDDGDLDLYVARYGDWKLPDDDRFCTETNFLYLPGEAKVRFYCSPATIRTVRHCLYRNDGKGRFVDVAEASGLGRADGRGFGVVAADLDDDGKVDLYVANDMCPNFLYLNRGDGTFDDATTRSGAGYDDSGRTRAGMGADAEDLDGDGRPELFVTNFADEPNSLFANLGGGTFRERSARTAMARVSMPWVGWGCTLSDLDNDGWPDAFVANGHVDDNRHLLGLPDDYAQPPELHRNVNGRGFADASAGAGPYFASRHVGRGVAVGDLDDDGRLDLVVNQKDGPAAVLRNETDTPNRWLRLHLVGTRSNRDAVGARVEVEARGRRIVRHRKGGTSLESAHDPRLLIGLGPADRADRLTIRWPSGTLSHLGPLSAGRTYRVVEPRDPTTPTESTPVPR